MSLTKAKTPYTMNAKSLKLNKNAKLKNLKPSFYNGN